MFASKATGLPSTDAVFEMEDLPFIGTVEATIYKEDIGPFIIDVDSRNSITPYVGIGLGSYVPQNKKISFALELGTYYIGEFVLEHTMPKGISTNNINYNSRVTEAISVLLSEYIEAAIDQLVTNLDKEVGMVVDDINSALKGYQFYPVIKLTIGFNLSSF